MRFLIPKLIGDYFIKIFFIPPLGLRVVADYESEYQMGAIEQQIFGLSKELALMGHQVYIIRRWKSLNEFDKIEGVNLININVPTSQRSFHENLSLMRLPVVLLEHFLFLKEVRQKITEIHPDIVNLSTLLMAYLFLKLERKDCWKIFINHSHDVFLNNGFFSLAKRRMIKSVIKNAHKTITLNKGMKQYLLNQGFRTDEVIPNSLSLKDFINRGEKGFVLFAGRLVPHKKVEELISAYADICEDFKEGLIIIGSGPCKLDLKAYTKSLGLENRVTFLPFLPRSKYRSFLATCSVFVLPSNAEAFGVVIIEAMACGKPVIAKDIIGPRDIIKNGYNGFLFKSNGELRKKLKMLLSKSSLRENIGRNARKTVAEKYTFETNAKKLEKIYKNLQKNA